MVYKLWYSTWRACIEEIIDREKREEEELSNWERERGKFRGVETGEGEGGRWEEGRERYERKEKEDKLEQKRKKNGENRPVKVHQMGPGNKVRMGGVKDVG